VARGRFITIEGGEGVGKSTHIATVRDAVAAAGRSVVVTREPGGTAMAERIRELLLRPDVGPLTAESELLLMFAARSVHLEHLIRPALAAGTWVVCDRFTDATYAYQGAGRGVDTESIAWLERFVQRGLRPDLTLLLDAPVEIAMARARARSGAQPDRFELEARAFFERVRAGYLDRARREPDRFRIIDASAPLEVVTEDVRSSVAGYVGSLSA